MKRIEWLDVARGLGILLVVLGHAAIAPDVKTALYGFHMPLFFLLAGRTFNPAKYAHDLGGLARGKFRRLVVPYLVCAPAFYLWWYAVARHYGEDAARAVPPATPLVGVLYANGTGDWLLPNVVLWFLPGLFCAELALWGALRLAWGRRADAAHSPLVWRELAAVAAAALVGYVVGRLVILPWSADVALVALPFLYAGVALARGGLGAEGRPFLRLPWLAGAVAALAAAVVLNGHVDMALRRFGVLPLFYLGGFAGSLLVLEASRLLARSPALRRPLSYLGRESLMVLIFHLLGFQLLSALLVFGLGARGDALRASPLYWTAQLPFAVIFSLVAAAVIKRVPVLREVFYPGAHAAARPAARVDAPDAGPRGDRDAAGASGHANANAARP